MLKAAIGCVGLVMMHVHIEFHHLVEIEGSIPPVIAMRIVSQTKSTHVMVLQKAGYLEKIGLLSGSSTSLPAPSGRPCRALLNRSYIIFSASR